MKKTTGDQTTHYVNGGYKELRVGGVVTPTKYYTFGAQRVAMRVITSTGSVVYYIHADHLGSASLTTDASGAVVSEARRMRALR